MSSDKFSENVLQFTDLFSKMVLYDKDFQKFKLERPDDYKQLIIVWKEVLDELVWQPGRLIYIEDKTQRELAKIAVDLIIKTMEP